MTILEIIAVLTVGAVMGWVAACLCGVSKEEDLRAAAEQRERFARDF